MSIEKSLKLPDFVIGSLACPLGESRSPLRQQEEYLVCDTCQKAFPIINGIPHLLPENALVWPIITTETEKFNS